MGIAEATGNIVWKIVFNVDANEKSLQGQECHFGNVKHVLGFRF
jgi:hypothetical protein